MNVAEVHPWLPIQFLGYARQGNHLQCLLFAEICGVNEFILSFIIGNECKPCQHLFIKMALPDSWEQCPVRLMTALRSRRRRPERG